MANRGGSRGAPTWCPVHPIGAHEFANFKRARLSSSCRTRQSKKKKRKEKKNEFASHSASSEAGQELADARQPCSSARSAGSRVQATAAAANARRLLRSSVVIRSKVKKYIHAQNNSRINASRQHTNFRTIFPASR